MIHELIKIAGVMGEVVELVGVLIIVFGFVYAFFTVILLNRNDDDDRVGAFRTGIKKNMLLGLDFLVAGDIIRTVTVDPSLTGVASLGFLVLIRTALVFTIHLEIEGHWPWQKKAD
ncbi:DUF1622 domain-containing protein [Pseudomonadota bacterium]